MAYRFGSFVFDRQRGLLQAGEPVPLEPQVFDLLGYLIDHRDRVVTKDELNDRIWNGRCVSEAALSTRIRAVRRALGDDRAQQKYVRTLPKRGFQFVAGVDVVATADGDLPTPERQRLGWAAIALALGLALAVLVAGRSMAGSAETTGARASEPPRSFRSRSCPSTTSPASPIRSISPMRSRRISLPICRGYGTPS
jgi:DNA-binding winged helix-turn-helix (wHTH) protein